MANLRKLYAGYNSGVYDDSLVSTFGGLNLVVLDISNNPKIKNQTLGKKLP